MVRKVTRWPVSSRRPGSGVIRAVVSRAGGQRKAARQAGEGLALSSTPSWVRGTESGGEPVWRSGPGR
jgi:hypothetical protein